ncbi:lipoprotein [Citrobacter sp. JGM124]|uniref:lipoprotein n=1 Tax=Citrobacter sp. JGM124 TaxID=2799789 RepID=UPI001BA93BB8|nr:lipoprotein [Citrobacter sp. JGM124]MBS0847662.1 lipoprotein [Citrobacter sp. JGM124]
MKTFFLTAILALGSLLVGCNPLTQYQVSENTINQALEKHNHFAKSIGIPGVADAQVTLTDLVSQIGREEPNTVILSGKANLDISSLFGSQKATIQLKMKTKPAFDKETGAIYLREIEIVDSQIEPEKMQNILQMVMPYLSQSLRSYFNQNPAYELSNDRSKAESLAKKLAKGIEVRPGEIIIPFTD